MRIYFFMIVLAISGEVLAQEKVLGQLRRDLPVVLKSEDRITQYLELLKSYDTPISKAYSGLLRSAQAEFAGWPLTKLSYFNDGKNAIESAVKQDPLSPEIRFARILVQCNAPGFLGYSSFISEDLKYILERFSGGYNREIALTILQNLNRIDCFDGEATQRLKELTFRYGG